MQYRGPNLSPCPYRIVPTRTISYSLVPRALSYRFLVLRLEAYRTIYFYISFSILPQTVPRQNGHRAPLFMFEDRDSYRTKITVALAIKNDTLN